MNEEEIKDESFFKISVDDFNGFLESFSDEEVEKFQIAYPTLEDKKRIFASAYSHTMNSHCVDVLGCVIDDIELEVE